MTLLLLPVLPPEHPLLSVMLQVKEHAEMKMLLDRGAIARLRIGCYFKKFAL
jgi:hypothetical protein